MSVVIPKKNLGHEKGRDMPWQKGINKSTAVENPGHSSTCSLVIVEKEM